MLLMRRSALYLSALKFPFKFEFETTLTFVNKAENLVVMNDVTPTSEAISLLYSSFICAIVMIN
jgi:hypothetical protein